MKYYDNKESVCCPKCHREIRNYPEESYALRESMFDEDIKVCAYCRYDEIRQDRISVAQKLDSLNLKPSLIDSELSGNDDEAKGLFIELPEQLNEQDKDLIHVYLELTSSKIDKKNLDTYEEIAKKYYNLSNLWLDELKGVETNNYLAIIYTKHIDKKYITKNSGKNPEVNYWLQKEIFDKLIEPKTVEEYEYKINACLLINKYEKDEDYLVKAKEYIKSLKDNFNIDFYEESKPDIVDRIAEEWINQYDEIFMKVQTASDKIEKLSAFKEHFDFLKMFNEGNFYLDGELKNLRKIPFMGASVHDYIDIIRRRVLAYEGSYIYYEYWIHTQNNKYLKASLRLLDQWMNALYIRCSNIDTDKYQRVGDENLNLLSKIIYNLEEFLNYYDEVIREIANEGLYRDLYKYPNHRSIQPFILSGGPNGDLSKESIAVITVNMIQPFVLIEKIIRNIENRDEDNKLIQKLSNDFSIYTNKLLNIFYKKKQREEFLNKITDSSYTDSSYTDSSQLQDCLEYMKGRIACINRSLSELRGLRGNFKEDIESFFRIKKAEFAPIPPQIPQDTLNDFDQLIDNIKNILVEKCSNNSDYMAVYNSLKTELGVVKYNYLGNEVLKTLATGEYLFKVFVENSPADDSKDFSCISIMYYKALEATLNEKIYNPYKRTFERTYNRLSNADSSITKYLPNKYNYFYQNGTLKEGLTLGDFAYLFSEIRHEEYFEKFLKRILKIGTDIVNEAVNYGEQLFHVKNNRNDAAHGKIIITRSVVEEDKSNIYHLKDAEEYRKLLVKLIDMIV